jgi:Protein of unknown function (DUF2505)
MATSRTLSFEYNQSPDEVAALLTDPVYLRHRSESAGEHNIDVRVEQVADGVRVSVAREKDVDVPAFAKALLGSARRAVETTTWRKGPSGWTAEYHIEVGGVPMKAWGKSSLVPGGAACRYTTTFEVEVRVPLIGKRLEAFIADGLEEQMRANIDRNVDALKRGAAGPRSYIGGLKDDDASRAGSR